MNQATINGWAVVTRRRDPYKAPEQGSKCLTGQAESHRRFSNGDRITTSSIKGKTEDGRIVTQNTIYTLGPIDPNYAEDYPSAKGRLLESLKIVPTPI